MRSLGYTTAIALGVFAFGSAFDSARAGVITLDNTDAGYSESGAWADWNGEGEEGTSFRWTDGTPGATATWSFSGVPAGNYIVSASHTPGTTRSTVVSYSLTDGIGTLGPVSQHSAVAGSDFTREVAGVETVLFYTRLSNTAYSITDGTLAATVSASSGRLIADAIRLESVRPDVQAIFVIDSENPAYNNGTYTETGGTWGNWAGDATDHRNSLRFGTSADATAAFAFTGLPDGLYRASATWTVGGGRPADARYYVDGGPTISIDQQIAPGDDVFEESNWGDLFTVTVSGGALTVNLENPAGGGGGTQIIADAMRLELIPEPGSLSLLACGFLAALGFRNRR